MGRFALLWAECLGWNMVWLFTSTSLFSFYPFYDLQKILKTLQKSEEESTWSIKWEPLKA